MKKMQTAVPNKRKQQAIATRKKILTTSVQLIREKGYDQVTIDQICEACNLSKGAFYHHFKSKLDIISESETQLNEVLEQVCEDEQEEPFKVQVLLFLNSMLAEAERSGVEITRKRTVYAISGEYARETETKTFAVTSRRLLDKILQLAIEKKEIKADAPIYEIREIIMVFVSGLIADWCIFDGTYSLTERSWSLSFQLIEKLMREYLIV